MTEKWKRYNKKLWTFTISKKPESDEGDLTGSNLVSKVLTLFLSMKDIPSLSLAYQITYFSRGHPTLISWLSVLVFFFSLILKEWLNGKLERDGRDHLFQPPYFLHRYYISPDLDFHVSDCNWYWVQIVSCASWCLTLDCTWFLLLWDYVPTKINILKS